jgi:hypothetical protein
MLHAYRTGAMSVGAASSEARSINENAVVVPCTLRGRARRSI